MSRLCFPHCAKHSVSLKVWHLIHLPQTYLGALIKYKFLVPTPDLLSLTLWGGAQESTSVEPPPPPMMLRFTDLPVPLFNQDPSH